MGESAKARERERESGWLRIEEVESEEEWDPLVRGGWDGNWSHWLVIIIFFSGMVIWNYGCSLNGPYFYFPFPFFWLYLNLSFVTTPLSSFSGCEYNL